jgi:hypothetical protein
VPAQLILEFEGVTTAEYDAVNAAMGLDPATGSGDWPDGLQVHAAGLNEDGHLVVPKSGTPPSTRPGSWRVAWAPRSSRAASKDHPRA